MQCQQCRRNGKYSSNVYGYHFTSENFCIAAESYGAYLAQGLIARYEGRIDGVVLICPVVHAQQEKGYYPHSRSVNAITILWLNRLSC